jgi:hypothetical protein
MATTNNNDSQVKTITPLTNLRVYKAEFKGTANKEGFYPSLYYTEPDRDSYPDDESYNIAHEIFEKNEKDFEKAKKMGMETFVNDKGGKKYLLTWKVPNDNGTYEAISGRLLNFFTYEDVFPDGTPKQKWVVDMFDAKAKERYIIELPIAVPSRKFLDKITSLTPEQLKHNIQISFNTFEINGTRRTASRVYVFDDSHPNAEYGKYEVEGTYEVSVWEEGKGYTSTPKGKKKDNEEYLNALQAKMKYRSDADFITFYKRIAENFQTKVLLPVTEAMFADMGFDMEIKDQTKKTPVKGEKVEIKSGESIWLTPNSVVSEETEIPTQDTEEPVTIDGSDEGEGEELPF